LSGIGCYNLQDLLQEGIFCTLTSFLALGLRSEGNAPKNGEPTGGFSFMDNSPAHRPVLVKDLLENNNVTTLEHPLLLTPAEFHPFP